MKPYLIIHCVEIAKSKVLALKTELNSIREATTSESKSTAGDKHETGRAMIHLEQEKLHKQLAEAQAVVAELERIDGSVSQTKIGLGSLIKTNKGAFFLAAGLGKIELNGQTYFVVSTKAPIAAQFLGRSVGDKANMNGMMYDIQSVE